MVFQPDGRRAGETPSCSAFLFYSELPLIEWDPSHQGERSALLSVWIQMLASSRNAPTDTPRIMSGHISGAPTMTQSSRHIKSTVTSPPLVSLAPVCISSSHPWSPDKDSNSDHNSASHDTTVLITSPKRTDTYYRRGGKTLELCWLFLIPCNLNTVM